MRINDVVLRSVVADRPQKLGNDDICSCRQFWVGERVGLYKIHAARRIPHSKARRYAFDFSAQNSKRRYRFVSVSRTTLELSEREPSIRMPVCEPRTVRYFAERVHFTGWSWRPWCPIGGLEEKIDNLVEVTIMYLADRQWVGQGTNRIIRIELLALEKSG